VTVRAGGHTQTDEMRSGGSYVSQHELALHFGLGRPRAAERVEIRWPSGRKEVLENVGAGQLVHVREGSGIVKRTPWR
jgi:hypothetical protein